MNKLQWFILGVLIAAIMGFYYGHKAGLKEQSQKKPLKQIISECSVKYKVPQRLIRAVIYCESRGNPYAVSKANCLGLMQISPRWHFCKNYFDPEENVNMGTKLLSGYIKKYGMRRALAYYSGGAEGYADKVMEMAINE